MSSQKKSDVIVVGGGIMGLFTALNLAERGRSVTVLERNRIWAEASAVNAGSLAVQNKLLPLVPYTLAAFDVWKAMSDRLGCDVDYHQTGGYKVATTAQEVARLRSSVDAQKRIGLPISWMEPSDIKFEAPWLSEHVLAASYCSLDSFASPTRLGPAIRRALERAGVSIVENIEIKAIDAAGSIRVEAADRTIWARDLVIAAGAWVWSGVETDTASISFAISANIFRKSENRFALGWRCAAAARLLESTSQRATTSTFGWELRDPRSAAPMPPTPMLARRSL